MKELPSSNCARHPGSEGGRSPEAPKPLLFRVKGLLGGSWVVISGLISRVTIVEEIWIPLIARQQKARTAWASTLKRIVFSA